MGCDVAGWPRLGKLVAIGLDGLAITGWVGHDVRISGSTPSLDHSLDGISIGISLDHMLVNSFWYVFLVEPSSCNLHEGTLVFLIRGGNNR